MKRLTLFAKGNVDVHDSLHSCRIGGELLWNGINEVLRVTHPGCLARVKHETLTRSDTVLHATGVVPEAIASRQLPLGSYTEACQFSRAIFDVKNDVVVLSIQADITSLIYRHKKDGYLFYPSESQLWTAEDRQWLKSDFERLPNLDVKQSMASFAAITERVRSRADVPVLIFNMSPITPGEAIHCYQGMGETYSTRIRQFNVGLIELSEQTGVSIIDVDSILARKGADALKLDALHLTPPAYRLLAEEVVRVLADYGVLEDA